MAKINKMGSAVPLVPDADFAAIKLLTCDVDGVLTDGGLYYGDSGERLKRFHVLDGQGIKMLKRAGVLVGFVSQSRNFSIEARARDLGVDFCLVGIEDKKAAVEKVIASLGFGLNQTAHIADDVNDLGLLKACKIGVAVPDAVAEVKQACRFVTQMRGGSGAVRELCDVILASRAEFG